MSLFIGRLDRDTTDADMEAAFGKFGPMKRCTAIEGKGFGFVEYEEKADADKALDALNGTDLRGAQILVAYTREKRDMGDRPRGCFNCGRDGHFARDCPDPPGQRGGPPRNRSRSPGRRDYDRPRYDDRPPRYDDRRGGDRYDSRPVDRYDSRPVDRYDDRRGGGGRYDDRRGAPPPRSYDRDDRNGGGDRYGGGGGGGGGYGGRDSGRDAYPPRRDEPRRDEPRRDYAPPAPRDQDVVMDPPPADSGEPKDKSGWGAIAKEEPKESSGNW